MEFLLELTFPIWSAASRLARQSRCTRPENFLGVIPLTDEQKELERKYELSICQLNMLIEFEKQHVPHDLDADALNPAKILETARDTFMALHVDWRAHIGDPVMDKREAVSRLLIKLAANVANGKAEL